MTTVLEIIKHVFHAFRELQFIHLKRGRSFSLSSLLRNDSARQRCYLSNSSFWMNEILLFCEVLFWIIIECGNLDWAASDVRRNLWTCDIESTSYALGSKLLENITHKIQTKPQLAKVDTERFVLKIVKLMKIGQLLPPSTNLLIKINHWHYEFSNKVSRVR